MIKKELVLIISTVSTIISLASSFIVMNSKNELYTFVIGTILLVLYQVFYQ